ncbi:hypothetical protein HH310_28845 [Actinoplanes sp. TBRC 11911]|uniref:hypothetical protein n=1 Tax=Actinoplanes sp. TBRC 11911 TaxID=2729386 RepID=UPI00145F0226|nr:hypothetical protein [Actinoplanes sp. TBRC 11911]NMO55180.1 hypothetical protein [Actinoplanes sp. TBRC 11911]
MNVLPAFVTRPLADAYLDALDPVAPPAPAPTLSTLDTDLPDGVPARLPLDDSRLLVLAVPLGSATPLLAADPRLVVVDDQLITAAPPDGHAPLDLPRPRLTMVVDGRIGDTVPVVPGVPVRLAAGSAAVAELIVDRLLLTAGALLGPGRSGSRLVLRWRPLTVAGPAGPAPTPGDPALDLLLGANR